MNENLAVLLIKCPDRPGIVAAISSLLFRHGANITDLDQHSSEEDPGVYFMRLELQAGGLDVTVETDEAGNVDVGDLKAKIAANAGKVAALRDQFSVLNTTSDGNFSF